ncbi:MAG: hypothetical protein C4581_04250, partial [Nitrospiraceae bacterium]
GMFLLFAAIVFYGMLMGFGRMMFDSSGASPESVTTKTRTSPGFPEVLSYSMMIFIAALIVLFGVFVPESIEKTIKACVHVLGAI